MGQLACAAWYALACVVRTGRVAVSVDGEALCVFSAGSLAVHASNLPVLMIA